MIIYYARLLHIQQRDPLMFARRGGGEGKKMMCEKNMLRHLAMLTVTKKNHWEKKALKNTKDFVDGDSLIENLLLLNGF